MLVRKTQLTNQKPSLPPSGPCPQRAEEAIPLTSDQDDTPSQSLDSKPSTTSLTDSHSNKRAEDVSPTGLPPPWRVASPVSTSSVALVAEEQGEATPSSRGLRSINTEPVISRDTSMELQDDNVTRLSFLHDEVEAYLI